MTTKHLNLAIYSEQGFWQKVARVAKQAGYEVIEKALWLYYAAQKPSVPAAAKAVIYGALAYLILPVDAIPDALPVVGFTDDLAILAAAVSSVAMHIDDAVKAQARAKLRDWFGT
jgi:uncharacterized membrane protein YkvA (DUF1232 family)